MSSNDIALALAFKEDGEITCAVKILYFIFFINNIYY
jgi:hypothetical protein